MTRLDLTATTGLTDLRPAEQRGSSERVLVACASLRTNLTVRELAAVFAISKSQAHRIIADLTPRLAALLELTVDADRRCAWVVDGTLVPTRDHATAAKSKNYQWSCNAQVLARRGDLRIVAIAGGGPGNRNDPVHYRRSSVETRCRQHRRVLADGGYRGVAELVTPVFRANRIARDRAWPTPQKAPGTSRGRDRQAQGLARAARPSPPWPTSPRDASRGRFSAQRADRIAGQVLAATTDQTRGISRVLRVSTFVSVGPRAE
jgi:hypothetical protein